MVVLRCWKITIYNVEWCLTSCSLRCLISIQINKSRKPFSLLVAAIQLRSSILFCQLLFWPQTVTTEILIAITNNNVRRKTSSFSALTGMMISIYHVSFKLSRLLLLHWRGLSLFEIFMKIGVEDTLFGVSFTFDSFAFSMNAAAARNKLFLRNILSYRQNWSFLFRIG